MAIQIGTMGTMLHAGCIVMIIGVVANFVFMKFSSLYIECIREKVSTQVPYERLQEI